jgi:DNA-binding MarR family transcriptional regulator
MEEEHPVKDHGENAQAVGDPAICEQVLVTLRRIIRAIDIHSKTLVQQYGITGPQLMILRELARNDRMPAGILARKVSLSHATVTGILDRLERHAFIKRERCESDRRRVIVGLTVAGREMLKRAPSLLQDRFFTKFEALEEWEQTMILSALQRLASMVSATKIEASPVLVSGPVSATAKKTVEFLAPTGNPPKGKKKKRPAQTTGKTDRA